MKVYFLILMIAIIVIVYIMVQQFKRSCNDRVYNTVMSLAPHAKTVLDLGCGSCCTTARLQSQHGMKVTSLDVVDKGVCTRPLVYDGKTIPFSDSSFDLGICSFVLHHTSNQLAILKELKRTCKHVLVLEDTPESPSEWKHAMKHAQSDWGQCEECFHTDCDWQCIFTSVGFRIVRISKMSPWLCPFAAQPWYYPVTKTAYLLSANY